MAIHDKLKRIDELCLETLKKSDAKLLSAIRLVLRSVARRNEAMCADILQEVEALCFDNGLTKQECFDVCSKMVDQDGKTGGRWTEENVRAWLGNKGLPECEAPHYNLQALVCAMNMMWSDHGALIRRMRDAAVESQRRTEEELCHEMALDVLKDSDGVFDIRSYFHV